MSLPAGSAKRLPALYPCAVLAVAAGAWLACDTRSASVAARPAVAATATPAVTSKAEIPQAVQTITDAFAGAASAIRPSVVRIEVEVGEPRSGLTRAPRGDLPRGDLPPGLERFFERFFDFGVTPPGLPSPGPSRGTGSGVIIDGNGHVLTNSHVIANAGKVTIILVDGRKFPGRLVGKDPLTDLGVVKFEKPPEGITMARMGRSENLRVGQWVLAVGSPLGLAQTVTAGIVSGLESGRDLPAGVSGKRVRRYIQTDASINPGNSGGPLVSLTGEVVGINTFINVGPGGAYGYAIAIDQAAPLSQILIKEGRVRYPYIGVEIGDVDELPPQIKQQARSLPPAGAYVTNVTPDSPAAGAGLKPGDVIVSIDGKATKAAADVVDYVSTRSIGTKVNLEYLRDGQKKSVSVTLAELPGDEPPVSRDSPLGLSLQTLSPSLARSLGVAPNIQGAAIADVRPGSPAEKAGLSPGDVIVQVDRKDIASAEEAAKLLGDGKSHLLRVKNAQGARFVTLPPPPSG
jgi:serine protease Do